MQVTRLAREIPFDATSVADLRRDFLQLLKNVDLLAQPTEQDYGQFRDLLRTWRERFYQRVYKQLDLTIPIRRRLTGDDQYPRNPALQEQEQTLYQQWTKRVRSGTWGLYLALGDLPALADWESERTRWKQRVQREARGAWRVLNELVEWLQSGGSQAVENTPVLENHEIEGFQVQFFGAEDDRDRDVAAIGAFRAGLRLYRQRAARVCPQLLSHVLPIKLDFTCDVGKGGKYMTTHVVLCASGIDDRPFLVAHYLAHEMGHHVWRAQLGQDAKSYWENAILGDLGDLDLTEVLPLMTDDETIRELAERLRDTDPVLSLQIESVLSGFNPHEERPPWSTRAQLQSWIDKGGRTTWTTSQHPVTVYGHKNAEEAFCEVLGLLIGYGPATVDPLVRHWFDTVTNQMTRTARTAEMLAPGTWAAIEKELQGFLGHVRDVPDTDAKFKELDDTTKSVIADFADTNAKNAFWPGVVFSAHWVTWYEKAVQPGHPDVVDPRTTFPRQAAIDVLSGDIPVRVFRSALDAHIASISAVIELLAPEYFEYQGLRVENPDRLVDELARKTLDGVDYVVALFKRRGMLDLLHRGLSRVVLRAALPSDDQTTLGLYYARHRNIVLSAEALRFANPRLLQQWTHEVFLHEFGHYIHLDYLSPDARAYWDSAWETVRERKEELEDFKKKIQTITFEERSRFWDAMMAAKWDPVRAAKNFQGLDKVKFGAWLRNPSINDPLITPKQFRLTETGRYMQRFFTDRERFMKDQYDLEPSEERYQEEVIRKLKQFQSKMGLLHERNEHVPLTVVQDLLANPELDEAVARAIDDIDAVTDYGKTNEKEDFAETFVAFMDAPQKLTPKARHRMQRTLSLSGLYGKPVTRISATKPSQRDQCARCLTADLDVYLNDPGKVPGIGPERGKSVRDGIVRYTSPHGSYRYVAYQAGRAVSVLQVVSRDGKAATIANVFTLPEYRRAGLATKLLARARQDFKSVVHAEDSQMSQDAKSWRDIVGAIKKSHP